MRPFVCAYPCHRPHILHAWQPRGHWLLLACVWPAAARGEACSLAGHLTSTPFPAPHLPAPSRLRPSSVTQPARLDLVERHNVNRRGREGGGALPADRPRANARMCPPTHLRTDVCRLQTSGRLVATRPGQLPSIHPASQPLPCLQHPASFPTVDATHCHPMAQGSNSLPRCRSRSCLHGGDTPASASAAPTRLLKRILIPLQPLTMKDGC